MVRLASPWPIRLVGRQQPNHQSDQLAGGQGDGPHRLVLRHFAKLVLIVSRILGVAQPNGVSGFTQVVAQITIAGAGEAGFVGLEVGGLVFAPLEASELGDFGLIVVEAVDTGDFGDDAARKDGAEAGDGVQGVRDGLHMLAYGYIRVSGEQQAEEGRSGLPRQILHIHQVAQKGVPDTEIPTAQDSLGHALCR